jgi:hypothetical protein
MFTIGSGGGDDDDISWAVHSPAWSVDALPLDEPWRGDEPARAMLVVVAERNVVFKRLLPAWVLAQSDDAARLITNAVHEVARKAGGYPRRVLVREWSAATRLSAELDRHDVDVRVSALRKTSRIIRRLAGFLDEPDVAWDLSPVQDWSQVEPEALDEYFRSAARFVRTRPWELIADEEAFLARRGGRNSAVVLTHPRAHGHVLGVYTSAADFPETFGTVHPVFGVQITDPARDSHLLAPGLPTTPSNPDPRPYPLLLESRDSDGPSTPQLLLVSAMLSALAALAESGTRVGPGLRFTDENGVELRLENDSRDVPWPAMKQASPGCATGPGADPAAALPDHAAGMEAAEEPRLARFAAGLSGTRRPARTTERYLRHAGEWTRYLTDTAGVPATAATELDLRTFLYDWHPRTTRDDEDDARAVGASLKRYFAFLSEREGIAYPWAAAVLRERAVFLDRLETAPLSGDSDELQEWIAPFHADLDARVMLPDRSFPGEHDGFDAPASRDVAELSRELLRRWQLWRDEEIASEAVEPGALRARLVARQREWERTPHPRFGKSPLRIGAEADDGPSAY